MPTWITGAGPDEPEAVAYTDVETPTSGKVTLRVPWEDRHDVIENIFANSLVWPYHPETGWIPMSFSLKGTAVSRTGVVSGKKLNTYKTADIELSFGTPAATPGSLPVFEQGSPGGDSGETALYSETYTPSAEMLKLPPLLAGVWAFRWGPDAGDELLTADEAPTRLIVGFDYVIRWVGLSTVPDAFFDAVGHVNEQPITSTVGREFTAEQLLCQSPVISRTVTTAATPPKWDVECRFSFRKDGWNAFWSPEHNEFRKIYIHKPTDELGGTEYKNFQTYDFAGMLP